MVPGVDGGDDGAWELMVPGFIFSELSTIPVELINALRLVDKIKI